MSSSKTKAGAARGDRSALVTGASAGIGAAFARRLARDGYNLIIVARSADRLEALAQELHTQHAVKVEPLPADLTAADGLHAVEELVRRRHLGLLVNNAGYGTFGRFYQLDSGEEHNEIELNVVALVRLTRAA